MSVSRYGESCEPGAMPIKFGIETLAHTPEPTHDRCPGGSNTPGLIGGWVCPCACHQKETKMIPSPGRVVEYTLSEQDVEQIERRRQDARASLDWHRENKTGAQIHVGNSTEAGATYPLVITKVWAEPGTAKEDTSCNGQVLLDGNDTLWVTSVTQGDGPRHWREFPRV